MLEKLKENKCSIIFFLQPFRKRTLCLFFRKKQKLQIQRRIL